MAKTEMIRARVEPELKRQAEDLFSALGLSATEAITLFYKQVTMHRGLPFDVRIPNAETWKHCARQVRGKTSPSTPVSKTSSPLSVSNCSGSVS